jgi:hypothetical protein
MRKYLLSLYLLIIAQLSYTQKPVLSFFNEMEGAALKKLFTDTTIIPELKNLNAQVRMGMLDTSRERKEILQSLNKAGVPVVAWLLLPKEKGYWFHSKNGPQAIARYHEIKQWADRNQIVFSGIGLDLELDINDIDLVKNHKVKLIGTIISRLYDKKQVAAGRKIYDSLVNEIRNDGYKVESYYVPFIRYENEKGRTALQQVSGFLDIKTDTDIPMLYSSFMGNGYGLLKVLAKDENVKSVAIGSTGGGFDTTLPSMQWQDLVHDIQYASSFADEIHIFSLEGAVQKGFLPKIKTINFSATVAADPAQEKEVRKLKLNVLTLSSVLSYPTLLIIGILLLLTLTVWLFYFVIKKIIVFVKRR